MNTTYVDTDLLEQMRERVYRAWSGVEEGAAILRGMHNQMMTEDLSLSYYPQWEQAMELCSQIRQRSENLAERMERMLRIYEQAGQHYSELEQEHIRLIQRLQSDMIVVGADLAGVLSPGYPLGLEEGQKKSSAMALEREVSLGTQAMEIANLTAIRQILQNTLQFGAVEAEGMEQGENDL